MSSALTRRTMNAAVGRTPVSRATAREVSKAVEQVAGRAVVHAAQIEAGAYVAGVGMMYAQALTDQEVQAATQCPARAYRFQAIADGYTALVLNEIRQLGLE